MNRSPRQKAADRRRLSSRPVHACSEMREVQVLVAESEMRRRLRGAHTGNVLVGEQVHDFVTLKGLGHPMTTRGPWRE